MNKVDFLFLLFISIMFYFYYCIVCYINIYMFLYDEVVYLLFNCIVLD